MSAATAPVQSADHDPIVKTGRLARLPPKTEKMPDRNQLFALFLLLVSGWSAAAASPAEAETEFKQLLLADEAALRTVDRLMAENNAFAREGAGLPKALLSTKVHGVVDPVRDQYVAFLAKHPDHVRGHLAYASFLGEFSTAEEIEEHLDRALELAPNDPVVLNNVAKHHAESGSADKAFALIKRALEANPEEPTYLRNLAGIMLVHRQKAVTFFGLQDEHQLFNYAAELYRRAVARQPEDFLLRTTLAQSLYHLEPFPDAEAVQVWEQALGMAGTATEKEGVHLHLARIHVRTKNYDAARRHLAAVTMEELLTEKQKLLSGLPQTMRELEAARPAPAKSLFNLTTAPPPKP
jgi:tetratricopeptide (TPR) repeat protein